MIEQIIIVTSNDVGESVSGNEDTPFVYYFIVHRSYIDTVIGPKSEIACIDIAQYNSSYTRNAKDIFHKESKGVIDFTLMVLLFGDRHYGTLWSYVIHPVSVALFISIEPFENCCGVLRLFISNGGSQSVYILQAPVGFFLGGSLPSLYCIVNLGAFQQYSEGSPLLTTLGHSVSNWSFHTKGTYSLQASWDKMVLSNMPGKYLLKGIIYRYSGICILVAYTTPCSYQAPRQFG